MKKEKIIWIIFFMFLFLLMAGCGQQNKKSPVPVEGEGVEIHPKIPDNSGCKYTSGGYELTVYWQEGKPIDDKLAAAIQNTYFKAYPRMLEDYGTCTEKTVTVYLEETMEDGIPAYAKGTEIHCLRDFLEENEENTDVLVHELFHIVQNGYPNSSSNEMVPVLMEGLADYARSKYGDYPNGVWSLPDYSKEQSYMDSYRVTAAFLVWISDNFDPSITIELNAILHSDQYTDDFWNGKTGYSIDELWEMYGEQS